MSLRPVYGHEGVRTRLASAIASGRLPQALLFEGPRGVGKQRLALWLAQALVCEAPQPDGPCGSCRHCTMALNLAHPDIHWLIPLEPQRKGSGDADKQVERVEEALAEEMAARREDPLYLPPSGMAIHGIASVRLLLRHLRLTPALARRKVFVVGDAERLAPQQGNQEAANALLKALEEPPADTVLILTSAEPEALLPTVLSRVARVRIARVRHTTVTEFAERELKTTAKAKISQWVTAAHGAIGKLLALAADSANDNGQLAGAFLAASRGNPADRYVRALAQTPFQGRGAFTGLLDDLLGELHAQAREGKETRAVVAAIARVLEARELAQGNVNPQLVAAVLSNELWSSA
jgi:DNA polymerase III subunit delta'